MNQRIVSVVLVALAFLATGRLRAGNPDRQGEAGGYELLINPWARSGGLHALGTSLTMGVEAMQINVAGLSRINKSEIILSQLRHLEGTGIKFNALGFASKMGKAGAFGISLTAVDFGDIPVTTTSAPEGTGADFSPSFFNIGLAYSYTFDQKVSVGILVRGVSENITDVNAFGFAIDAGVQYVAGAKDNFKFGISLRNMGSPMKFGGEGLSFQVEEPDPNESYVLTASQRPAGFELPSMLNIGLSYDFYAGRHFRLTPLGNFTANSFSVDQIGAGLEFSMKEMFMARVGYRYDLDEGPDGVSYSAYTGLSAGLTIEVPTKKDSQNRFAIDYAYLGTNPFNGSHTFSLRYKM
jgi:hypothetical protein